MPSVVGLAKSSDAVVAITLDSVEVAAMSVAKSVSERANVEIGVTSAPVMVTFVAFVGTLPSTDSAFELSRASIGTTDSLSKTELN